MTTRTAFVLKKGGSASFFDGELLAPRIAMALRHAIVTLVYHGDVYFPDLLHRCRCEQ